MISKRRDWILVPAILVTILSLGPGCALDPSADEATDAEQGELGADAPTLGPVLAKLKQQVTTRSPGTQLAVAVFDTTTNEYAGLNDEVTHVSASSAKAIWVAAALKKVGVGPVTPHA